MPRGICVSKTSGRWGRWQFWPLGAALARRLYTRNSLTELYFRATRDEGRINVAPRVGAQYPPYHPYRARTGMERRGERFVRTLQSLHVCLASLLVHSCRSRPNEQAGGATY